MSCAASSAYTFVDAHHRTSRSCFAVSEADRQDVQIFLHEPVQHCTEEQVMHVPVHARLVRGVLSPPSKPSLARAVCRCCDVLELRFNPLGARDGIHILGTCSKFGVGRDQFVGDRGLGTKTLFIKR